MEAIKISIEVSVNLSENTQNFIKLLLRSANQRPIAIPASSVPTAPTEVVKSEEPKKPSAPAAAPALSKSAATPAPSVPAAPAASSASKTIEDVRAELAKKVNDHRNAIKNKLTEFGAPSVTKLDPSKYDEMYNFLAAL